MQLVLYKTSLQSSPEEKSKRRIVSAVHKAKSEAKGQILRYEESIAELEQQVMDISSRIPLEFSILVEKVQELDILKIYLECANKLYNKLFEEIG